MNNLAHLEMNDVPLPASPRPASSILALGSGLFRGTDTDTDTYLTLTLTQRRAVRSNHTGYEWRDADKSPMGHPKMAEILGV